MNAGNNGAEKAELHRTIWRIANDLRGSVDGWDFKSYVLGMLFYRFISENLAAYLNDAERKAGNPDFDYAALSDEDAEFGRRETVVEKGFYILPSDLFVNVRARARHDENLNETLSRVFADIEGSAVGADSEDDLGLPKAGAVAEPAELGAIVAPCERFSRCHMTHRRTPNASGPSHASNPVPSPPAAGATHRGRSPCAFRSPPADERRVRRGRDTPDNCYYVN